MRTIEPLPLIEPKNTRYLYKSKPTKDKTIGFVILLITWSIFIGSVLAVLNVWTIPNTIFQSIKEGELDEYDDPLDDFPIKNYYSIAILLVPVAFWLWSVVSWTALKLFKHSKGVGKD